MSKVSRRKREDIKPHTDMKPEFEHISVAQAQVWLTKVNELNRARSKSYIQQLAVDMVKGDFKGTHEGIAFDKEGYVVDGQHRLEAIVLADKIAGGKFEGVDMFVFYNVPRESMDVINSGRKWQFKDHMGIRGIKMGAKHGSVANVMMGNGIWKRDSSSTQQKLHFIDKYPFGIDFAATAQISPSPVAAVVARAFETLPEKRHRIREFVEVYRTGRATSDKDWGATTLRDYIRERKIAGESDRIRIYVAAELALSAFLDNKPLKQFNFRADFRERFPLRGEPVRVLRVPKFVKVSSEF